MSDPNAFAVDVALDDLIQSNLLPFNFSEDMKLMKFIAIIRGFPADYKPPNCNAVSGQFLDNLYDVNWNSEIRTLLDDYRRFGISLFGDGATINTVPMVNDLADIVHSLLALPDFLTCSTL